jgi:hypothetical protein
LEGFVKPLLSYFSDFQTEHFGLEFCRKYPEPHNNDAAPPRANDYEDIDNDDNESQRI